MSTIPFVWSNDDICFGRHAELQRELAFIERFGITGVFFLIPRQHGDLDQDSDLLRTVEKARGKGHEFYQHGFMHTAFECGVPDTFMMQFSQRTLDEYDIRREQIEADHTLESQVRMLNSGQAIWRRAFHEESVGFRPGWGAFCTNFYRALSALNYQWTSSRIASSTVRKWNQGDWDAPMTFREDIPLSAHKVHGVIEHTITSGDYSYQVPDEPRRIEAMVNLALHDLDYLHKRHAPMILTTHWHGLERNGGTGYAVQEKLIPALLATGKIEPMGMAELHRRHATV
jgi:hypothetical protein